jgi:single-strand DNA-binding protein
MTSTPIHVVGNLTDDPELRFTPSGAAVVKFSVAVNRRIYDRQKNEWTDAGTDFHRVTAWNFLAQNIAETLTRGMRVLLVGELRQDHWTDEKTNEKRSAWSITATAVGPELTFATAEVKKSTKSGGIARGDAPDDPWATGSAGRPAGEPNREERMAGAAGPRPGQGAWPKGAGAPAGGYSDEPPF